jgi:hypothetical protein
MESAYDTMWQKIVLVKPKRIRPSWSLHDIFRCIDKHWIAVFGMVDGVKSSDKNLVSTIL